jgi:DNA-binding GntR family transcriptional regulator
VESRKVDRIREDLEQRIIAGEFQDGDRLDEVSLAEKYQVSRTPLREALRMLAGSSLLEILPQRGAFVRHPGLSELVEMFEVMAELEALCGRLASKRISTGQLATLSLASEDCKTALTTNQPDEYYRANEDFHRTIYQAAGNQFLAEETERLQRRLRPFRRIQLQARGRMQQSMDEHEAILAALTEGNADEATATLRNHVIVQGEKFHTLVSNFSQSDRAKL